MTDIKRVVSVVKLILGCLLLLFGLVAIGGTAIALSILRSRP